VRQVLELSGRTSGSFDSILFARTYRFAFTDDQGRLVTEQLRLEPQGMRVSRVRSTGHCIRLSEDRDATFLFPRSGQLALRVAGHETRVAADTAVLVRPTTRLTAVSRLAASLFDGHVLMLPQTDLDTVAQKAGLPAAPGPDVVPVTGAAGRRLSAYVAFLLSDVALPDAQMPSDRALAGMAALMRDLLLDWCMAVAAEARPPSVPASLMDHARVRRAEEILRARFADPLTVGDVADDLEISLRSLQQAFHAVYGEGPRARLTRIRLDAARAQLMRGARGQQVTSVALECGFTHLGRFAAAYLRAFGEHPHETLLRSRSAPGRRLS
jgi:AraC-like DNA-binding protein